MAGVRGELYEWLWQKALEWWQIKGSCMSTESHKSACALCLFLHQQVRLAYADHLMEVVWMASQEFLASQAVLSGNIEVHSQLSQGLEA